MAKDPAFLFYPNDWLGGTMILNRHQKGCYIDLLIAQFNNGPLSLEMIKTILGQDQAAWTVLSSKFKQDPNGNYFSERLAAEIEKRKEHSLKQKDNAMMRWHKSGNNLACAKVMPLENRNGNEDGIAVFDAEKLILSNQIEFERICMTAKKKADNAKQSLHKYHLYLEEKEQYPKGKRALFAGFEKWLLNESSFKNFNDSENEQPAMIYKNIT